MPELTIKVKEKLMKTAPNLYGIFLEDINRAVDGGLYPELLRNRSFEDSLLPDGCHAVENGYAFETDKGWRDEFNGGEGLTRWVKLGKLEKTEIPGWYTKNARMALRQDDTLNEHRRASLEVEFTPGGSLENVGFCGIAQTKGESYRFYMFAKAEEAVNLTLSFAGVTAGSLHVEPGDWKRYDLVYEAAEDALEKSACLCCAEGGRLRLGFVSLMPVKTFKDHGMRSDIAELLKGLQPKFFRFPGGCIVEGFTPSTMWRFADTVGPVWERPGKLLMWHYRTYDGIGFHEYLQFCEDLNMEPLYVCNCGMTCQARKETLMEGKELEAALEDTLNAIEYAVGGTDTKWGALRAQMGHPEPFLMNYIEIGNENWGENYETRYRMFYDAVKAKYPHIQCIADSHLEKKGLEAQIVDEHYYDTTEWFAENTHLFDAYDRNGPEIFLGEVAVVRGYVSELYAALGEAAFFTGVERNQDIVTLASYAPLLENVNYQSWSPNLIRFDHTKSFGIPSYYVWKMFGAFRGEYVAASELATERITRPMKGRLALLGQPGLRFRNPVWNGAKQDAEHEIMGRVQEDAGSFIIIPPDEEQIAESRRHFGAKLDEILVVFGDEVQENGTFGIELYIEKNDEKEHVLGIFPYRLPDTRYISDETHPPAAWNVENVKPILWKIKGKEHVLTDQYGPSSRELAHFQEETCPVEGFTRYAYRTDGTVLQLYHEDILIGETDLPSFPAQSSVVTADEKKIYVKLVNMEEEEVGIEIKLDCEVETDYTAHVLTGGKTDINSFEEPEHVSDKTYSQTGAAADFTYRMPALCVAVLELTRKGDGR